MYNWIWENHSHKDTQPNKHTGTETAGTETAGTETAGTETKQAQRHTATQAQRHRVAGTNLSTVPVHIKSSTSLVPVTYRHRDKEWLAPVYQQYPQYQYI